MKRNDTLTIFDLARHKERPNIKTYIDYIFDDFIQLHGDRCFGDDKAIIAGIAYLSGIPVTVIGHVKGNTVNENIEANFAMAHPEGYRKALRQMKLAEKFNRPIICFVNTPGAFCGVDAEKRGQGQAIAQNLVEMMGLKVPVIAVVTGEGGSGGALGIAVANSVLMLQNAIYSVISPKGFASILWKDASREREAAVKLKLTAYDLLDFGVIDGIIEESKNGAHTDPEFTALKIKEEILKELNNYLEKDADYLISQRYERFRKIGCFQEVENK